MPTATCAEVSNDFIEFSQLLPSYVSKEIQMDNFYNTNIERGDFVNNSGRQYTYPVFGRGLVVGDEFAPFAELPAEGSTCDRPTQTVKFGYTNRTTTPRHYSQKTELLCLTDLIYDWRPDVQLPNTVEQMANISKITWANEYQNVYVEKAKNKVVADSDKTTGSGASFPAVLPTSPLTWGLLQYVYDKLILRYGRKGAAGYDTDGRPIFHVVSSSDVFQQIKKQDSNMRDDLRWAFATDGKGNPLLSTPGIASGVAYNGWKFNTVDFPPRYKFEGGAYVQVFPLKTVAGSGTTEEWDINEEWENADYQVTVVFLPNVLKHLVVKPTNFPAGYRWDAAQNWAGEFLWNLEAKSQACNPNGDKGWWQANYVWGAQELRTDDLGYAIMHLRCAAPEDAYTCVAPGPVTSGS